MRADWPVTALSLDEWRRAFGIHPYHFWGMADSSRLAVNAQCNDVTYSYAWQGEDEAGRFEIAEAIARAEAKLLQELRFRVAPQYVEATLPWPRLGDTRMARTLAANTRGNWLSVALPEGEVIDCGVEQLTLLGTPAITYSDPNGDGVNELATFTQATTATDPSQIAVYFAAADRVNGDPVAEPYRIRPLAVTIAGGVATIKGDAWLFVAPILSEGFDVQTVNPADTGVLVTTAEVYTRTTNQDSTDVASSQGVIIWETRPCHGWWCCCTSCLPSPYGGSPFDPDAIARAVARVGIRNARVGLVDPAAATYDATAGTWASLSWGVCWEPDRVTVRYLAGRPLVNGRVAQDLAIVTARLAAAEVGRPICGCREANRELYRWQTDLARTSGANDEAYAITPEDLNNPFGTRRGHVEAWKYVQAQRRLRGTTM